MTSHRQTVTVESVAGWMWFLFRIPRNVTRRELEDFAAEIIQFIRAGRGPKELMNRIICFQREKLAISVDRFANEQFLRKAMEIAAPGISGPAHRGVKDLLTQHTNRPGAPARTATMPSPVPPACTGRRNSVPQSFYPGRSGS